MDTDSSGWSDAGHELCMAASVGDVGRIQDFLEGLQTGSQQPCSLHIQMALLAAAHGRHRGVLELLLGWPDFDGNTEEALALALGHRNVEAAEELACHVGDVWPAVVNMMLIADADIVVRFVPEQSKALGAVWDALIPHLSEEHLDDAIARWPWAVPHSPSLIAHRDRKALFQTVELPDIGRRSPTM